MSDSDSGEYTYESYYSSGGETQETKETSPKKSVGRPPKVPTKSTNDSQPKASAKTPSKPVEKGKSGPKAPAKNTSTAPTKRPVGRPPKIRQETKTEESQKTKTTQKANSTKENPPKSTKPPARLKRISPPNERPRTPSPIPSIDDDYEESDRENITRIPQEYRPKQSQTRDLPGYTRPVGSKDSPRNHVLYSPNGSQSSRRSDRSDGSGNSYTYSYEENNGEYYSDDYYGEYSTDEEELGELCSELIRENFGLEALNNLYRKCRDSRSSSTRSKGHLKFLDVIQGEIQKKQNNKRRDIRSYEIPM